MDPSTPPFPESRGLGIARTATHLRNLAGWFLRLRSYEHKYRLAYHLYDCGEEVTTINAPF